jgi:hypothetical protein
MSQASRRQFSDSSKTLCSLYLTKVGSPVYRPDGIFKRPDTHQSATFVRTQWQYSPDSYLRREASNSSRLNPSRRHGNMSGRSLEFQKNPAFKCISESVRTTWLYRSDAFQYSTSKRISFADTDMGRQLQPFGRQVYIVWTLSLIRQDMQNIYNRSDVNLHCSDA